MSSDTEKAWLTELLKLCHFYRSNAAVRQGLPDVQPLTAIGEQPKPETVKSPNIDHPAKGGVSLFNKVAMIVVALSMASIGAGVMQIMQRDPAPAVSKGQQGSLLQFLEDEGHHIYGPDRTDTP